jgi:hypothetical protein
MFYQSPGRVLIIARLEKSDTVERNRKRTAL